MIAVSSPSLHPLEAALAVAHDESRDANATRWLRFAHVRPGDVLELQALNVPFGNSERTYVAHASSSSEVLRLLDEAKQYKCPGLYVIANRVDPAVATRLGIDKWYPAAKGKSTTDRDILCRTVLFVDIDSERPSGTSATDTELAASVVVATELHGWLSRVLGGSSALGYGASGNGRGVYIALDDLPETEAGPRVKAILVGLDLLFTSKTAKVDTAVSDAKRLVPAFGTMKKKGAEGVVARPHRKTAFTCTPAVGRIGVGDLDRVIEMLRGDLDAPASAAIDKALGIKPASKSTTTTTSVSADSPFSRANAVDVEEVLSWVGAIDGDHPRCPGCGESDQGVVVINNGLKCSHARCASKGVRDGFRTPVDIVAEARSVEPREAVTLMAERFGFDGFARRVESQASNATLKDSTQVSSTSRFKVWSPEEIWAPLAEPIYTVGGLLRRGNLALLVAYGSSFKTWEMVDLAIAQASGGSFLGRFECPTPGPVLLIDWESGDEELRRRLQAVSKARGFAGAVPGVEFVTMPELFFTGADFEAEITKLAQTRTLIAFDSLAAGSVDVDENDARFAKGLQALKRVATLTGCSMLVLHHARKSNGEVNDEREMVRGSGAIFAAADVVLVLIKQDDDAFLCKHTKSRGGKKIDPFLVRVEDVLDGGVRVYASETEENGGDSKVYERGSSLERAKAKVLALVAGSRDLRSVNEIHRRLGGRKKTIFDAATELEERGTLTRHDGAFRLTSEVR